MASFAECGQAAQGIDRDAALQKALEFQQSRKDDEQRREDIKRQAVERDKGAEERNRGRDRGMSR